MNKNFRWLTICSLGFVFACAATEYHVATTGCDTAAGSAAAPWRTIQRAADVAVAGDVVTIHAGVYREWVRPQHAGRTDAPITYQAAKGEKVVVTGADQVTGWTKRADGLWTAKIGYNACGGFNPFTDFISGNWFSSGARKHYRTRLVQNGKRLKLHGGEVFRGSGIPKGACLVNIAGLTFGSRTIAGAKAVQRKGPHEGHDTKWGLELGWIEEGASCVYEGVDLSTPSARELEVHYSSEAHPALIELSDAADPQQKVLATVETKSTGHWRTYASTKTTLPASMAGVKNLRLVFRAPRGLHLPTGHAALVPGMVAGTIVAAFEQDPNVCVPELVMRPACFYPTAEHRDYHTVRGITFENAGPNWAPPTSEQVGIIGTNWSRGWVIEDCTVSGSSCTGITLGKFGDAFDNCGETAAGYHATIMRAVSNGLDRVGHHLVRRCRIFDCGQAGICGSLGAVFSTVENCEISYCHWRQPFDGCEQAGIKIHGAVDFTVSGCRIHHCGQWGGIWFDWMGQGARVVGNTLWSNQRDLFFEVDHGPILVEGNTCLSAEGLIACSQSVAFIGNRIRGTMRFWDDARRTPIFEPHSVKLHSLDTDVCKSGAHLFINNILGHQPNLARSSIPCRFEDNWMIPVANWKVDVVKGTASITPPAGSKAPAYKPVTAARLGTSYVIKQPFPVPTVTQPTLP